MEHLEDAGFRNGSSKSYMLDYANTYIIHYDFTLTFPSLPYQAKKKQSLYALNIRLLRPI